MLLRRRIETAQSLLVEKDWSVEQVAAAVRDFATRPNFQKNVQDAGWPQSVRMSPGVFQMTPGGADSARPADQLS